MKNSGNILLGILGAAAAGVVIGMIVAPQKGSQLRSDIRHSADDLTKKLAKLLNKGRSRYDELRTLAEAETRQYKKRAYKTAVDATDTYNDYSNKAEEVYNKAEEVYNKAEGAYNELANGVAKAYKKAKS